jgi:hypothetical protein
MSFCVNDEDAGGLLGNAGVGNERLNMIHLTKPPWKLSISFPAGITAECVITITLSARDRHVPVYISHPTGNFQSLNQCYLKGKY